MRNNNTVGRVGTNKVYGKALETWMGHPYLVVAVQQYQGEIKTIMGRAFQRGGNI